MEHKVQIFFGILAAVATIYAAIIGATWKAESTAKNVAEDQVKELVPSLKLFPKIYTKNPEIQQLGNWQACVLVESGTIHATQACTCLIEPSVQNPVEWQLRVNLDPDVNGYCNCRAACFNGFKLE